jgi:hypothetical protein
MFYTRAYQYYNRNYDEYREDIILKCDDDIVYFDIEKLKQFIAFRRKHDEVFLISANVVNNGVCAYFQQSMGLIRDEEVTFELPPGGLCGSLWSDGEKAESIHSIFLRNPSQFVPDKDNIIAWNERISINFVAFLGRDFACIPDIMHDDEHDLCYGVRKRAMKQNCIYPQFVAAHLSFWRQDATMRVGAILDGYHLLATAKLGPAPETSSTFALDIARGKSERHRRSKRALPS